MTNRHVRVRALLDEHPDRLRRYQTSPSYRQGVDALLGLVDTALIGIEVQADQLDRDQAMAREALAAPLIDREAVDRLLDRPPSPVSDAYAASWGPLGPVAEGDLVVRLTSATRVRAHGVTENHPTPGVVYAIVRWAHGALIDDDGEVLLDPLEDPDRRGPRVALVSALRLVERAP